MKRYLFLITMIVFGLLFLISLYLLKHYFYPSNYIKNEEGEYINIQTAHNIKTFPITKNTRFCIEHFYTEENRTLKEDVDSIPALLGCDLNGVNQYLKDYMKHLSIEEQEKGLQSFQITSFNKNKIVLRKIYKKNNYVGYYIQSFNGTIVILNGDKKTVYDYTRIPIHTLPNQLQEKVIEGYYIENEDELYNFLENYSS